ncbi:MAG: hypothetical protein KAU20_05525 [Nanoarchaeota archaeon]|nr:hypothetical protein [Nanoarchaeota archaeon]
MKAFYYERLFRICHKIREIFAEHITEITFTPDEESDLLFINIHTNSSIKESLDLLEKFDEEYWIDNEDEDFEVIVIPKKEDMVVIAKKTNDWATPDETDVMKDIEDLRRKIKEEEECY